MMSWRRIDWPEVEAFYKGVAGNPFAVYEEFLKSTGMITSDMVPDYRNPIYGAYIWRQLNLEANVFGALPKLNWPRSGWRVQTSFATDLDHIAIGESQPIPDAVFPGIKAVRARPKVNALVFEMSEVMEALFGADDLAFNIQELKNNLATEFVKMVNRQIVKRVIGRDDNSMILPNDAVYTRTVSGETITVTQNMEMESLDRIVSSYDEVNAFTTDNTKNVACNVYNLERANPDGTQGADAWSNAIVKYSVDGQILSDDLIRTTIAEMEKRGGYPSVIFTGYDTYAKILGIYIAMARYDVLNKDVKVKFGMNGIETVEGIDAGIKVASLYGIPLIKAVDVPSDDDTGKFLQRIFILDTSDPENYGVNRLGISVLRPVEAFETRDFPLLGKIAYRGMVRMLGEVTAKFLPQAKIRDLLA